jgi:hypothetical protein
VSALDCAEEEAETALLPGTRCAELLAAKDAALTLLWPDPSLGMPDPSIQAEIDKSMERGEMSLLQLIQRKYGYTREQALEHVKQCLEDEAEVKALKEEYLPAPPQLVAPPQNSVPPTNMMTGNNAAADSNPPAETQAGNNPG